MEGRLDLLIVKKSEKEVWSSLQIDRSTQGPKSNVDVLFHKMYSLVHVYRYPNTFTLVLLKNILNLYWTLMQTIIVFNFTYGHLFGEQVTGRFHWYSYFLYTFFSFLCDWYNLDMAPAVRFLFTSWTVADNERASTKHQPDNFWHVSTFSLIVATQQKKPY